MAGEGLGDETVALIGIRVHNRRYMFDPNYHARAELVTQFARVLWDRIKDDDNVLNKQDVGRVITEILQEAQRGNYYRAIMDGRSHG